MTRAFYSGFYPDGLGVGGTALGSASHRGIEDIIKNLDDISIQRLIEARAQLKLQITDLDEAVQEMNTSITVTIPGLIDAAEAALSGAITNINNKISLSDPTAGSIGERVLGYQTTLNGHASRLSGVEAVIGTDDAGGSLMGRIATLEEVTTDGTLVTSTQFNNLVSSLTQYAKVFAQDAAPTTGMVAGDLWIDTDDGNKMYRYTGATWENVTPEGSSMRTFAQPEPPAEGGQDDLWFDTDDNNKMYRKEGANWVPMEDPRIATITANINTLNQTVIDLEANKASASTVSSIASEISSARGGEASLGAKLTSMTTAITDGLAEKSDASRVTALEAAVNTPSTGLLAKVSSLESVTSDLQSGKADASLVTSVSAKVDNLDNSRRYESLSGHPGQTPEKFTSLLTGSPATVSDLLMTGASIETDPAEGKVYRIVGVTRHIWSKGWVPLTPGESHKITARVRVVSNGLNDNRTQVGVRLSNEANENAGQIATSLTHTAADGWQTIILERTTEQLVAGKVAGTNPTHFRVGLFAGVITTGTGASGATVEVSWVRYENVTEIKSLGASVSNMSSAVSDLQSGKADASRVAALEASVNTAGTGLLAKVSTLESATADLQSNKADASRVSTLEATVVMRPNILPNGGIENGVQGMSAGGPGSALYAGVDPDWGAYIQNLGTESGTYSIQWPQFDVREGSTYTISGDTAYFHAGGTSGNSYLDIMFLNAGGAIILDGPQKAVGGQHDFSNGADRLQSHAISVVAPSGAVKAYARAIFTSMVNPTFMAARRVKVERGDLPATLFSDERSSYTANARIANAETAIVDLNNSKASASSVNEISATLEQFPNLLLNSDFTQGSQDWVFTGPWTIHNDAAWGSMAMALGGPSAYHYIWQDVPIYGNNSYTLSWTGDGGTHPERLNIYVECKSPTGDVLSTAGNIKMTGVYWHTRKHFTFHAPTGTAYIRVVVQKNSTGQQFDCFVSRFMLNYGEHPRRWTNDSNIRGLGARLTTVSSAITDLQNGKAEASRVTSLEADLNTANTGIKARLTTTEAVAVAANGKAQSTYGVVAEAGGSIVGFQLAAGGNSSSFKIRADKFEVASASSSGARTVYSGNSWKVYDNNNVLRVEMGVF